MLGSQSGKRKAGKTMNINVSPMFDDPLQEDAGATDYAEIFIDQMNGLYLLSFLITADRQIAERCFSKALDEYVDARGEFLEWAKQDGRRAVLRHSIQIMRPAPKQAYSWSLYGNARPLVWAAYQPFAAITSLSTFERFVFVMSVIEGFSPKNCAALLKCSIEDVVIGRELAGMILAAEDISCDQMGEINPLFAPSWLCHQRCGIC
jgi:hypothetical protein